MSLSEPHASELAGGMSVTCDRLAGRPFVRHFIVVMDVPNLMVLLQSVFGVSVLGWQTKGTRFQATTGTFFSFPLSVVCWISKRKVTSSNPSRQKGHFFS